MKTDLLLDQVQFELDFVGTTERRVPTLKAVRWNGKKWVELLENTEDNISTK